MTWRTLGDVAEYINGRAFKPNEWETAGLPIIRIQNLTGSSDVLNRTTQVYPDKYRIYKDDLLFAWSGSLGPHIWRGGDAWLNQHIFKVIPHAWMDKTYLYYYLLYMTEQLYAKAHGSGMVHITLKPFKSTPIYVPALDEQQRIAKRIEGLFTKLDGAVEKVRAVIDSFELRRMAVLDMALAGNLTKQWRVENGLDMAGWEDRTIKSVCSSLSYGTAKKSSLEGKVAVIRMGNLRGGEIQWDDLKYSDDDGDIAKYKLRPGDVLFNRTNSADLVGKTAIYRGERPAIYAGYLIKLEYDRDILNGDFLNYVLNSTRAQEYCNRVKTDGVNQSNINAKKVGAFTFPIPTLREQIEIVSRVQSMLRREEAVKNRAKDALYQVQDMKRAILTRAFRGELRTKSGCASIGAISS